MPDSFSMLCQIPLCMIPLCLIPVYCYARFQIQISTLCLIPLCHFLLYHFPLFCYDWFRYDRFRYAQFPFFKLCLIPLCHITLCPSPLWQVPHPPNNQSLDCAFKMLYSWANVSSQSNANLIHTLMNVATCEYGFEPLIPSKLLFSYILNNEIVYRPRQKLPCEFWGRLLLQ